MTHGGVKLGKRLGTLKTQRKRRGKGQYLTKERIAALDRLGMIWDGASDKRERNYQAALNYYQQHGNLIIPADYVNADGLHLGR